MAFCRVLSWPITIQPMYKWSKHSPVLQFYLWWWYLSVIQASYFPTSRIIQTGLYLLTYYSTGLEETSEMSPPYTLSWAAKMCDVWVLQSSILSSYWLDHLIHSVVQALCHFLSLFTSDLVRKGQDLIQYIPQMSLKNRSCSPTSVCTSSLKHIEINPKLDMFLGNWSFSPWFCLEKDVQYSTDFLSWLSSVLVVLERSSERTVACWTGPRALQ